MTQAHALVASGDFVVYTAVDKGLANSSTANGEGIYIKKKRFTGD
jgi:hypothetical protein